MSKHHNKKNNRFQAGLVITPKENDVTIKDKKSNKIFGLTLMRQESIDSIYKLSGPLAHRNEFQVHYTALTGEYKKDGQVMFVNIPLIYYNYKQIVSGSHVSFHMDNVKEVSDAIEPIAVGLATSLLGSKFIETLKGMFEDIEFKVTSFHTLHRHPSGVLGFSGTDYKKNPDNPGIVYPILETEDTCSFSSIIISHKNTMKICRTECREVKMDKKNVVYSHGQSICHVSGYEKKASNIESIFGVEPDSVSSYEFIDGNIKNTAFTKSIFNLFDELDFTPSVEFISKNNVYTVDPDVPKKVAGFHYDHNRHYGSHVDYRRQKTNDFSKKLNGSKYSREYGDNGLLDHMKAGLRMDEEDDEIKRIRDAEDEVDGFYMALQDEDEVEIKDIDDSEPNNEEEFEELLESDSKEYEKMFPVQKPSGYILFNQDAALFDSEGLAKRLRREMLYFDEVPSEIFALSDEEVFDSAFHLGIIIEKVRKERA